MQPAWTAGGGKEGGGGQVAGRKCTGLRPGSLYVFGSLGKKEMDTHTHTQWYNIKDQERRKQRNT